MGNCCICEFNERGRVYCDLGKDEEFLKDGENCTDFKEEECTCGYCEKITPVTQLVGSCCSQECEEKYIEKMKKHYTEKGIEFTEINGKLYTPLKIKK